MTTSTTIQDSTSVQKLAALISRYEELLLPLHSILIYQLGDSFQADKLLIEKYYDEHHVTELHRMYSCAKSFVSIAIGLLIEEKKLSLGDPIIQYFPEYVTENTHPWIQQMTIRDMLMMRTCFNKTTYKHHPENNWVESFFITPPDHAPGESFHYDTSSAHTLCALVEKLTGQKLMDYLKIKLAPITLSADSYLLTDPFGSSDGGSGLMCTSRDLGSFGRFIAHNGQVNGVQLLSSNYIVEATSNLSDTSESNLTPGPACGYGYQFWRSARGSFLCYGMDGQFILHEPEQQILVVVTANTHGIPEGPASLVNTFTDFFAT